jgi:hypothetical protein
MQQLAAAAQLSEPAARSIAAAISSHGQAGIGAVKQGLDPHVGFGQIKVVAALMALRELWFAVDEEQQQQQHAGPAGVPASSGDSQDKQQPPQQEGGAGSLHPVALTDASNLPLPTPAAAAATGDLIPAVCAGMAAAGDQQMAEAPAEGAAAGQEPGTVGVDACSDDGDEQPSWRTVKRARPAFNISNKTGKRRRPTIAPPAAAVAAPAGQQEEQLQQQQASKQQQAGMVSPAPTAAAAAAALTTPAGAALITQQAVLQLLWDGTATGKQLLRKLGVSVSGSEQEQQLQQVLQALVEEGEQVLVTPEGAKVDINDECVRFIAF